MPRLCRVARRGLILTDISTLQSACSVHRSKPADDVTERSQNVADDVSTHLTRAAGSAIQRLEHAADETAVMPLFVLYLFDAGALGHVADRVPVSAIGTRGGELTRIRKL